MSLFDRFRRRRAEPARSDASTISRTESRALAAELTAWVARHPDHAGVTTEAWIEEANDFNPPSMLLVGPDGDSRRWRIPDVPWAGDFCRREHIPYHRGGVEPYPQRMRDYKARERALLRDLETGGASGL